jgi:hypothetical protein
MSYTITFPYYFKVTLYINGIRLSLSELARMRCMKEWCLYELDGEVIDKLNTTNCSVRIEKYYPRYTVELSYTCKEFIKLLKELNEL